MRDALNDIRQKISDGAYKNEEHVRLSLVARVLLELEWNVWDPEEVNSEYKPVAYEDSTKVDIALFSTSRRPDLFIEVKSMGKISSDLAKAERQLRDYNRDNSALFTIITDGRVWRFYLSQARGKFSERCFKQIDLLDDDLDDIENSLNTFLKKVEFVNGNPEREAQKYLRLTEKQRIMEELLPQAKRTILEPPFPSLPEALVELVAETGFTITAEEAQDFIKEMGSGPPVGPDAIDGTRTTTPITPTVETIPGARSFRPEQPPDLHFTKIIQATLGSQSVNKWNALVRCAVKQALKNNVSISHLKELGVRVEKGQKTNEGFRPLTDMNVSVQGVGADKAWYLAWRLAKELNSEIMVGFKWRERAGAAHPGEQGLLHWKPQS